MLELYTVMGRGTGLFPLCLSIALIGLAAMMRTSSISRYCPENP
jgi:hypothetical protein